MSWPLQGLEVGFSAQPDRSDCGSWLCLTIISPDRASKNLIPLANSMRRTSFAILIAFIIWCESVQAATEQESCATDWTTHPVKFEGTIDYGDMQTKADPTVRVMINGKVAKMILDTGANFSVVWDTSLIDFTGEQAQRVHGHVASAEGYRAEAILDDGRGNVSSQLFYIVRDSVLVENGYSGLLSPQAVAGDDAVVIDFERNCFFISPAFDIRSDAGLAVHRGSALANPYRVMAIPVTLAGGKIPLIVDTGASVTSILASLVASRPKGKKSFNTMDVFGAVTPNGERMRLVDLSINGQTFKSHPVVPRSTISEHGIVAFGHIGMDILKDHIVYYDGSLHDFTIMTRNKAAKPTIKAHRSRVE